MKNILAKEIPERKIPNFKQRSFDYPRYFNSGVLEYPRPSPRKTYLFKNFNLL